MKNKKHLNHDVMVKAVMSHIDIAKDYFRFRLPTSLLSQLDIESLDLVKDSFVTPDLAEVFSDLVFTCKGKSKSKGKTNICLIFEHKTDIDKWLPVQLLSYISQSLRSMEKNQKELSIPIVIVFSHGSYNAKQPHLKSLFPHCSSDMLNYLPYFEYLIDDIRTLPDETIASINNGFLASFLLTIKHYKDNQWLKQNPLLVLNRIDHNDRNLIKQFTVYFFNLVKFDSFELKEIVKKIDSPYKKEIMSTADMLKAEGKMEGKVEGKTESTYHFIQKCYNRNFDIDTISELVSLSRTEVNAIINELKAKNYI
jgi:predicted transposase/invertase (TIGR01784 family)